METDVIVRQREETDRELVAAFLEDRSTAWVARLGEFLDAREQPALIAEDRGRLAGVLTYIIDGDSCEVLTVHVADQWGGVGSALLREVGRVAREAGCSRLWLITTNDNLDALRFYQRRGFHLAKLHAGGIVRGRELKPEIPATGEYGIPIHDELELHKEL